jgi:hypothetical protein
MTLYFAYGSNMSRAGMQARCPRAVAIGTAILEGYRFFIGIDGWGSIERAAGARVPGVLWRISPRDRAALHAYELLDKGLYHVTTLPVRRGARLVPAMTYLLRRRAHGRPKPGYIDLIGAAARDWNLPQDYIRSIERWSCSRRTAARGNTMDMSI